MFSDLNTFEELAARAGRGDRAALADLEGRMVSLVRAALSGVGTPDFRRRVRATARRLARYAPVQPPDRERLVRRVASCLSESLVDGLARGRSGRHLQETVVA